MLNQAILVGRIVEMNENMMTLRVSRSYKNEEGIYESDDIRVEIVKTLNSSMEYLEKGVLVGVKGRLMSENNELRIVAEKLTFLTSNRSGEEE